MKSLIFLIALLLFVVATANAQCAWILWENSHPTLIEGWVIQNGFQTYDQCKKAKKDIYERIKKTFLKMGYRVIDDTEDLLSMGLSREGVPSIYYGWMCLPDTIDPRK
jgi:hypothetical protein